MSAAPFRKRTLFWLVIVGSVSFLSAIVWALFGSDLVPPRSAGADSYSRSALGHAAFVELLREMEIPLIVSRHDSAGRASSSALLVLAEPCTESNTRQERLLKTLLGRPASRLLVLPKWTGTAKPYKPAWVEHVELIARSDVETILDVALGSGSVVRPRAVSGWDTGSYSAPTLARPQLIESVHLRPLIRCAEGILLGQHASARGSMLVLSDPDLLANHGLGKGDNAVLVLEILDKLRKAGEPVILDETLHGYKTEPNVFRTLMEFPLVLAFLQGLVALALVLWAAVGRFGAPASAPAAREPGKRFLIDNTAALLRLGGHSAHALNRYFKAAIQGVCARLQTPPGLTAAQVREWLDDVAAGRGMRVRVAQLEQEVKAAAKKREQGPHVLRTAVRIHGWKQEMTHGR